MISFNETLTPTNLLGIELSEFTIAIDEAHAINNYECAYTLLEQYELLVDKMVSEQNTTAAKPHVLQMA